MKYTYFCPTCGEQTDPRDTMLQGTRQYCVRCKAYVKAFGIPFEALTGLALGLLMISVGLAVFTFIVD